MSYGNKQTSNNKSSFAYPQSMYNQSMSKPATNKYTTSYKGYPQPKYSNKAPGGYNSSNYKYGQTLPALKSNYKSNYSNVNNQSKANNSSNLKTNHNNQKPNWNSSTKKGKKKHAHFKPGNPANGGAIPSKNFGVKPQPLPTIKTKKKY